MDQRYLMELRSRDGSLVATSSHTMDTLLDAFSKYVVEGYIVAVRRKTSAQMRKLPLQSMLSDRRASI